MTASRLHRALGHVRAALRPQGADATADGDLLGRYVRDRDGDAFAALVRRHGPMVLGVCRRVLGNPDDAEDAFQATFLVLARRAASVRPRRLVGNWLYGVAHRTALAARRAAATRRAKEARAAPREPAAEEPVDELRAVLDRELARLPDNYRAVLVLADLEGRPRAEVARLLGVPEGTVASRQARARARLAAALARHRLRCTAAGLAAALGAEAAARVPAPLLGATVRAALTAGAVPAHVAALAKGVQTMMLLNRLKVVAGLLLLTACVTAAGVAVRGQQFQENNPFGGQAPKDGQGANRAKLTWEFKHGPRWEYKILSDEQVRELAPPVKGGKKRDMYEKFCDETERGLQAMGEDGWELCSVVQANMAKGPRGSEGTNWLYYFKRSALKPF
jgi:RNA polymerase sigma factor (sigma-70 family)